MNSILNSISSGDLEVRQAPQEIPIKEDSIIDLLQNSEIEFKSCPKLDKPVFDLNTGFGNNNELHYNLPCTKPKLQTPLYVENYLSEFVTSEEKAAARKALGIYGGEDIITMNLLTAEDKTPPIIEILNASVKQMRKGGKLFLPITNTQAVFDKKGVTLDVHLNNVNKSLEEQQKTLNFLLSPSNNKQLTSLGDVTKFLQGFNNGDTLHNTLDELSQEMLRFEKTGQI